MDCINTRILSLFELDSIRKEKQKLRCLKPNYDICLTYVNFCLITIIYLYYHLQYCAIKILFLSTCEYELRSFHLNSRKKCNKEKALHAYAFNFVVDSQENSTV